MSFRSISLPKGLVNEIELIINSFSGLGYTSNADFVKEAVRIHIQKTKDELRQGWRGSWTDLTRKLLEIESSKESEIDLDLSEIDKLKAENVDLKRRLEELEEKFPRNL